MRGMPHPPVVGAAAGRQLEPPLEAAVWVSAMLPVCLIAFLDINKGPQRGSELITLICDHSTQSVSVIRQTGFGYIF